MKLSTMDKIQYLITHNHKTVNWLGSSFAVDVLDCVWGGLGPEHKPVMPDCAEKSDYWDMQIFSLFTYQH